MQAISPPAHPTDPVLLSLYFKVGQREIFAVMNGTRRGFPDFATFVAMGHDTDQVRVIYLMRLSDVTVSL